MRLAHQLFGARVGTVVPSSPTSFSSVTGPGTPQFSSVIVSRPRSSARALARLRGLALGAAFYGLGLTLLVLSPFLILEVMPPPKAGVTPSIPAFVPPGGHGDHHPAGPMPRGVRGGRMSAAAAAAPRKTPAVVHPQTLKALTPPPEPNLSLTAGTSEDGSTGTERPGDPNGTPEGTSDSPGGCPSCTGKGPGPPGDPEGPYEQGTEGLIPPSLIPGTRALPVYPDIARRAGLQGSVILLVVIEADGTVGEIQVVRNADPRWGFDLAAIEAVKRWRYQPALMNGLPVAAYIQVMVEFSLAR